MSTILHAMWTACLYGTYGLYVECGAKEPRKKGTPIFMCMDNSHTTNQTSPGRMAI
jgi:hypothetical protein